MSRVFVTTSELMPPLLQVHHVGALLNTLGGGDRAARALRAMKIGIDRLW